MPPKEDTVNARTNNIVSRLLAAGAVLGLVIAQPARACTGIELIAVDGTVVHARTLEFGIDLKSNVIMVPRGYSRTGTTPDGKPGKKWTSKYASLGTNALGMPILIDGLNEQGLAVGLFYFPTSAKYQPYAPGDADRTVAPWELGSYILENFATVDEVRANVPNIVVPGVVLEAWKFSPPAHYVVHDATGKSIAIEYTDGKLNIYDNPLGVMTNSPAFDWQMTNLRNYVNFSLKDLPPVQVGSVKLVPFGQGSGMLGLPGDFTPPSRFVRAVAFSQSVLPSQTGYEAVLEAFHILNDFDIPKGASRGHDKDEHGNVVADYTIWTSASDLKAKRFYFRSYENSQIRMIDLTKQKMDGKDIVTWSMKGDEVVKELGTPSLDLSR
jgi:choloylglycine hydrolase